MRVRRNRPESLDLLGLEIESSWSEISGEGSSEEISIIRI
jgi:hypothetical protein